MSAVTQLRFGLHAAQQEIHNHPARFKVVAAGRRFGKSTLASIMCIVWAMRDTNHYGSALDSSSEVVYIGTTLEQARRNVWHMLKKLAEPVIAKDKNNRAMVHENTSVITLVNGVRIRLLGMDDPDAARGMKIRAAVLDEYAQMPETAWPEIIRPALMDCRGWALFIGTPKGRNHFFELFTSCMSSERGEDWAGFNFSSYRNTFLSKEEIDDTVDEVTRGSSHLQGQEIEAKFVEAGGNILRRDHFIPMPLEPDDGQYYIAADLAGFSSEGQGRSKKELKQRDDHAIAVVKVFPMPATGKKSVQAFGWWIKEIVYGKWDVRTCAFQLAKACNDHGCMELGIEKGIAKNAVMPYLEEYLAEYGLRVNVEELTHGNKHKADRIRWALEGRGEKGRLFYRPGRTWNETFFDQATSFPSRLVHDDLIDAVSYVDQMAENIHIDIEALTSLRAEPLDLVAGY